MVEKRLLIIVLFAFVLLISISFAISAVDDLMALQGNVKQNGVNVASGDLVVTIWDASAGGNKVYNSTTDFSSKIIDGKYDVFLGSGSNSLSLEYGRDYYLELFVNNEQFTFDGAVTRQRFQAGVGQINASFINKWQINETHFVPSVNLTNATGYRASELIGNLGEGQNVSAGIGGWFKGMFNFVVDSLSSSYLVFNGTTLNLTTDATKWFYNQTTNSIYYYNMSTTGLWAYNQSLAVGLDTIIRTNNTYTNPAWLVLDHNYNHTLTAASNLTNSWSYLWYNQTLNSIYYYNQSLNLNQSLQYNQTLNSIYYYNQSLNLNTSLQYNQTFNSIYYYNMSYA
ncbi:MAG: hypothetical protein KKA64_02885, partial [Nanoarchaeota archaeon]|nr:hypothetical protein [Nanoarchaeota archaeon]